MSYKKDDTTLYGILGLVFGAIIPIIGVIFAAVSVKQAKQFGHDKTLGYMGYAVAIISVLFWTVISSGGY